MRGRREEERKMGKKGIEEGKEEVKRVREKQKEGREGK